MARAVRRPLCRRRSPRSWSRAATRTSSGSRQRGSSASRGRATTQPARPSIKSRRWRGWAIPAAPPWIGPGGGGERRGRATPPFPVPHFKDGSPDFSFSGLKTSARARLLELELAPAPGFPGGPSLREEDAPQGLCDLMADVEEAIVAQLLHRLSRLHDARRFPVLSVSGGVAANTLVRERIPAWGRSRAVDVRVAPRALTGDNAVMIAFVGLRRLRSGRTGEGLGAVARSRWPLETLR